MASNDSEPSGGAVPGPEDAAPQSAAPQSAALDVAALDVAALDVAALDVAALDVAALDVAALDVAAPQTFAPSVAAPVAAAPNVPALVPDSVYRPIIGLPTYAERARFGSWDIDCTLLPRGYADLVHEAGGIPVLLPPIGVPAPGLLDRLDGIVLTGGADIDPARYAAAADPATRGLRPDRDGFEFELFALARARSMPVLAICRGLQLVNVALGGTLLQHLPDVLGHTGHNPTPGAFTKTLVATTAGSAVAAIAGLEVTAHCHHHQAIDRLAEELFASAYSVDGIIEAVETRTGPFLVGVQWHPEADATDHRLMAALVTAAATYGEERDR
ncbi:gamma-glutamyl-gamma-aminobutyrate hydrolase family protein [Nocardia acididurans]|uniref:gamma-glutamyl-gamma-aminobutyrate hydrolase family protein n=1 Tax=Nocardia acididurans TaxID=2802282 RepID=UPI0027DE9550|nr:gamma-glutamyl-gamma-aminobutyrate hydrolase family protein [Nocardia acididurans]